MKLFRSIAFVVCLSAPFSYTDDESFSERAIPFGFGLALGGMYRVHKGETVTGITIASAGAVTVLLGYAHLLHTTQ